MRLLSTCAAFISVVLAAGHGCAQSGNEGMQLLEKSTQFAQSLRTFYVDMSTTVTQKNGQTVSFPIKMWVEMPEKMTMRMEGPMASATYLQGNRMTTYMGQTNQYMNIQLPTSPLKDMMSGGFTGISQMGGQGAKPKDAKLLGKETKDGIACNHIAMTMPDGSQGELWLADGSQPLPVFAKVKAAQAGVDSEVSMKWIVNQPIPAATFEFTPPPGATEMKVPAMQQTPGGGAPAAGASPRKNP